MIQLSQAQAGRVVDALSDSLTVLDEQLNGWGEREDDPDGERADLMEEYEQTHRLRELVIAQIGKTRPRVWECDDDGCAWLNPVDSTTCEQCGREQNR